VEDKEEEGDRKEDKECADIDKKVKYYENEKKIDTKGYNR